MPKITVKAKGQYPDVIAARSLFIDSLTVGAEITVRVFFEDGSHEDQLIVTGSKFNSPDSVIEKILFINATVADADITYHYSTLIIYDENVLAGNVTVLGGNVVIDSGNINSITEPKNQTLDGNEFTGSCYQPAVSAAYAQALLWNPLGSAKTIDVSLANLFPDYAVTAVGGLVYLYRASIAYGGITGTIGYGNMKSGGGAPVGSVRRGFVSSTAPAGWTFIGIAGGSHVSNDGYVKFCKKRPFEIAPNEGLGVVLNYTNIGLACDFEWSER